MKKLLNFDISLKKILRRAVLEKNKEMEYIDWLNVVFKFNPSDKTNVSVISLRPKDKTKYSKGTYFRFVKFNLEKAIPDSILLTDYINTNGLVGKKFSEILSHLVTIFGNAIIDKNVLTLDTTDVQLQPDTDTELNVRLLLLNNEKKFVEVNKDMKLNNKADLVNGKYFLHVFAGEKHPIFFGERFILLK